MRIVLDITRTLLRRNNPTPSGIDRVEFAFLARLLEEASYNDVQFVISTHVGCGVIPLVQVKAVFAELSARWTLGSDTHQRQQFVELRQCLESQPDLARRAAAKFGLNRRDSWSGWRHARLAPRALGSVWPVHLLTLQARTTPTYYVHVSHVCLEHPIIFRWATHSPIKPVFFLHDIIPIDYPEFCTGSAVRAHTKRVETVSRFAEAIIVNSQYTRDRLEHFLAERGLRRPPIVVSWLGTDLPSKAKAEPIRSAVPYFLHVGTIEARKNVHQLLNIWRRMLSMDGPQRTPRLVLAGRRGWKSQDVFDALDCGRELASHVVEAADLNDSELALLMQGATAVLAPSLVEGFGLPGAEALARRIPVVASDIAAHREILGEAAMLIDPTDGPGWANAIRSLARSAQFRQNRIDATRHFRPLSWRDHVDVALTAATVSGLESRSHAAEPLLDVAV